METLHDSLSMFVVIGKDNGLSNILTTLNLQTTFHQLRQNVIDSIIIDKITENLITFYITVVFFVWIDTLQHLLIIPNLFKFVTLFLCQLVILDAVVNHL